MTNINIEIFVVPKLFCTAILIGLCLGEGTAFLFKSSRLLNLISILIFSFLELFDLLFLGLSSIDISASWVEISMYTEFQLSKFPRSGMLMYCR